MNRHRIQKDRFGSRIARLPSTHLRTNSGIMRLIRRIYLRYRSIYTHHVSRASRIMDLKTIAVSSKQLPYLGLIRRSQSRSHMHDHLILIQAMSIRMTGTGMKRTVPIVRNPTRHLTNSLNHTMRISIRRQVVFDRQRLSHISMRTNQK